MHGSCRDRLRIYQSSLPRPHHYYVLRQLHRSRHGNRLGNGSKRSSVVRRIYSVHAIFHTTVFSTHLTCYRPTRLLKLFHKLLMEFDNAPCPVGSRSKESGPEMQCAFLLSKACASNNADTCGVEHAEAVELVGRATFLLGLLDGLFWEVDGGEEVHGALMFGLAMRCVVGVEYVPVARCTRHPPSA